MRSRLQRGWRWWCREGWAMKAHSLLLQLLEVLVEVPQQVLQLVV
jgi:hypothetical protein